MKKILIGCALVGLTMGCARISYNPEGFTYTRLGKQSIEGLEVTKLEDGSLEVKVNKQEGSSGDLTKLMSDIAKVAAGAAGMQVVPR